MSCCKKYFRKYNNRLMQVCAYFCMFFPRLFLYALFTPDQGIVCLWRASAVWSSVCQRLLCESETNYIFACFVAKSIRMTIERNMIKKKQGAMMIKPRFRDWILGIRFLQSPRKPAPHSNFPLKWRSEKWLQMEKCA